MATRITPAPESISAEQIDAFEQANGLTLPADYRAFLLRYNGGCTQPDAAWIPDRKEYVLVGNLYGLGRCDALNLQYWLDEFGDEMPPGFVIIGEDPGGAMFILGQGGHGHGVYLWDHQHRYEGSSEEAGNTFFLVETFAAWLDSLRELPEP